MPKAVYCTDFYNIAQLLAAVDFDYEIFTHLTRPTLDHCNLSSYVDESGDRCMNYHFALEWKLEAICLTDVISILHQKTLFVQHIALYSIILILYYC